MDLTLGDAALGTARGLIGGALGQEIRIDFAKIIAPRRSVAFFRRLTVERYEFQ